MPSEDRENEAGPISESEAAQVDRWRRNSEAARRGGQPGNTNALRHGIYADRFLCDEERALFEGIVSQLEGDFVFNTSSDFIQVELVALYCLKLGRALEADDLEAAQRIDQMMRCHLKDLRATKITREDGSADLKTTPAEWATALLERVRNGKGKAKENDASSKTQA